jgi:uncharacterized protein involved in exopolysaccharide biosynthesis
MDVFDLLAREWPLITGAPVLAIGGGVLLAGAAFIAAWKLKGSIDDGELRAYRAQLQLAKDREADAKEKRDDYEKQVADLKAKAAAGASKEELAEISARVDAAFAEFQAANNAVNYVLNAEPGKYVIRGGDIGP